MTVLRSMPPGFGSQWLVPYEVQGGRLARINLQLEF